MIAILDTGGANHSSIQNALARLDCESEVTLDYRRLQSASHVILPGVGHAAYAMERLRKSYLCPLILAQTKPVLGICLGMQLLFSGSEEGPADCLGLLPGTVTRLQASSDFRVPNMGWAPLARRSSSGILLDGVDEDAYFYFVHSYRVPDGEWIAADSRPPHAVPAVIEYRNFFGVQFHPERSGTAGARVLKNFVDQGANNDSLSGH